MNEFTRKWNRFLSDAVLAWMMGLIPLGVAGFWWHPAWVIIGIWILVIWILATTVIYDRRWQEEEVRKLENEQRGEE